MSTAFRSAPPPRRSPSARRPPLYPLPAKPHSARSVPNGPRPPLRAVPSTTSGAAVRRLPRSRAMPLWLRLLIQLQHGSLVLTFILVTAALLVYGSTVYTQQLWGKEYRKLKTLQRNEREMVATNEGLKNQLALQAEKPGSGLVLPNPDSTIFLQSAPPRPLPAANPTGPLADPAPKTPLGY